MYDACVPWPERPKGAKDKSRGPKSLELEVGARRAPKLLVFHICSNLISYLLNSQAAIRFPNANATLSEKPIGAFIVGWDFPGNHDNVWKFVFH